MMMEPLLDHLIVWQMPPRNIILVILVYPIVLKAGKKDVKMFVEDIFMVIHHQYLLYKFMI